MDKKELYDKAMEAYYSGEEIISDQEFDSLEEELGLKNKVLGSSHSNAYTIKHPYIMGSLSKVQIKDKYNLWDQYFKEVNKYISHFEDNPKVIITPKFDGCSFEILFNKLGRMISASTRGDGHYGKDIMPLIQFYLKHNHIDLLKHVYDKYQNNHRVCLRGELLIDKKLFASKYSTQFKNPRSFVSSVVNSDWSQETQEKAKDISIVIYDTRYHCSVGTDIGWKDVDWFKFFNNININLLPDTCTIIDLDPNSLSEVYNTFLNYRDEECQYPLDGIVIKPIDECREFSNSEYPSDCVAVKFEPLIRRTTIHSVEWSIGKTMEYIPTVVFDPVIMDGKEITRASASNYGNVLSKGLYPGTEILLSLAGDIIPYIYSVEKVSTNKKLNLPKNSYIEGIHLMSKLSDDSIRRHKFINSILTLNIPNFGESTANEVWNNLVRKPEGKDHILCYKSHTIYKALGKGKYAKNAADGYNQVLSNLTLSEIIQSCNFTSCGPKVSDQIENMLLGLPYDFSHLPEKSYKWSFNRDSEEFKELFKILSYLNKSISDFEKTPVNQDRIPIIMTGKPTKYKSKKDFLDNNPQYVETSSWNEVKIVFTGNNEGETSKMKKARERGIQIELY